MQLAYICKMVWLYIICIQFLCSVPFVKINLWVGAPGGHSFQVPMFLNGKKVQSETWRDGRKMVCSRIGECKEIKIGWSAESCGVQSFRRLNSWPIPMSPCQICQCVTKVVSWTPLDHQGKQHLLWCAQSRHWRLGSTKYIADVCSLRILRLRFFRKSEKAPKAPLLLQILHQPQLSSLDGTPILQIPGEVIARTPQCTPSEWPGFTISHQPRRDSLGWWWWNDQTVFGQHIARYC